MAARIEDYALIGDCQTAALVDRRGSIDWLCWPTFSSEACFAKLLGTAENGYWKIAPCEGEWKTTRKYREHTLIVETVFESAEGAVRLTDFMPVRNAHSNVVRVVEGIARNGEDGDGALSPLRLWADCAVGDALEDGVRAMAGPNLAILRASVETRGENLKTLAEFKVAAGEREWFSLTYGLSHEDDPGGKDVDEALQETENFWQEWTEALQYEGKYREIVERSLITLKAMTYMPTGGVVAAVTTSLPECIGGVRNWDYRYCWLRDTTFTLLALSNAGYYRRSRGVAGLAAAGAGGKSRPGADYVWSARRTAIAGVGSGLAAGIRRIQNR